MASERNNRPTAAQRLFLLNGSDVQRKIQQSPALQALAQGRTDPRQVVDSVYLTVLSRLPTDTEAEIALGYAKSAGPNRRVVVQDLAWALINSAEFRYRH